MLSNTWATVPSGQMIQVGCLQLQAPRNTNKWTRRGDLNIAVCVKHIPDPNLPGEMDGERLKREGIQGVLDPGDEFGVEAGLQLKEAHGGEVTLVSMGPEAAHGGDPAGSLHGGRQGRAGHRRRPRGAPMR